ncbi:MAG: DNA-3-methyladenine glycosylase I [Parcubacteria group bacterium Athens0714_16]|nr:MAG: DNA-3-methyladenine glycosylase I [Parcubacteria group bacterium Athens0714_16]
MKEKTRCVWPGNDLLMIRYHDEEWGVPIKDDKKIFEFLVLESAQAGLSWRTILYRRNGYKRAFANFNPKKISKFTKKDVNKLLKNIGIIRNKLKIESTINNAKRFLEVQREFGSFSKYMWGFVKGKQIDGKRKTLKDLPAITKEAEDFSKDLKKRGFKFLGPTVVYAHMQAVGMVNDHTANCFCYTRCKKTTKQ